MTAEMDVHGDSSEVKERRALDMNTYEDLPKGCNAASHDHDYVTAATKDDADSSYVFVSSTDAATNDDHVSSDLSGQGNCAQNADMEINVEVHNGESNIQDGKKPESCLVDFHISDALEDLQLKFSEQVKESDTIQDDITVADVLQSSDTKVNEAEHGVDTSQKVDDTRILEDNVVVAINDSSDSDANCCEVLKVESPKKVEAQENEVESSQMADNIQIQEDNGIVAIIKSSDTRADHGVEIEAESSLKVDGIQSHKENGTVAIIKFSDSEANPGTEIGAESSQKAEDIQIHEENGIMPIIDFSDTEANARKEIEVESSQNVEGIEIPGQNEIVATIESSNARKEIEVESSQNVEGIEIPGQNEIVATIESSNARKEIEVESSQNVEGIEIPGQNEIVATIESSNSRKEIEAESSQKVEDIEIQEQNEIVAAIKSSNIRKESEVESSMKVEDVEIQGQNEILTTIESSNTRKEIEVESSQKVEDIEIQGQNEIVPTIECSSTMAKGGEEIEVKSSQKVGDIQIAEYNGIVGICESSNTVDNCSEDVEVASFERVEDIEESQDANLEAAACNCINSREMIDEIQNKSELGDPVQEIGESQITSMSSTKPEPDQPDDSVENTKGECKLGLALNVENSERTQVTSSKDGENNRVVGEEQAGSIDEVPLLEPSGDNKVDLEQSLAAVPYSLVNTNLETENPNSPISISNEEGMQNSVDQDGPLDTNDGIKTSPASVNCEIAIVETCKISPSELVSDAKIGLNEITKDEQEVNHVLELEESSEIPSGPIVDECVKAEVLEGTISENGDDMPTGLDESRISDADDTVSGSQLIPEGNKPLESIETTVSACMIANAPAEIRESFSTLCLNDPVLKPDLEVEDSTKSESVASTVNHVQPDKQVSENHDICLLGNTDLETKFENGHTEKDNQSTFPSNDMRSEPALCISIGCEEEDSTVSEVPNGINESSVSQPNSVDIDSELHDNESSSVPCPAAIKRSEDVVEITSTIGSRDMPDDDCIVSESEVLNCSLANNEGDLNTMADIVVTETDTPTKGKPGVIHESSQDEPLSISPEGSAVDALEGPNVGAEVGTRPFYFLIRVPRYDNDNLREQIKCAQSEVDQKTQDRDAIRVQIQTMRATWKVCSDNLEAAVSEERAARDSLKSKRQEIDSVQSLITKVKNAMSIEDIDGRLRNIEHTIEHETLPLKEEKQLIREIKQLKQLREQLSLTMGKQDELQQALDQKEQIEERLKLLRKEVDLLRDNVLKAESITKAAKKKYNDENAKLDELQSQFKAADKIRQEAYANLQGMRKQLYEKNKFFWKYRDDVKEANDLASSGDRDRLQHLCVNQVETMMELWNNNDEFRKDYIRCNMRSTLRRLRTLDGRSLGPHEEPPVLTSIAKERSARDNPLPMVLTKEREKLAPTETLKDNDKSVIKIVETKNQTTKCKKPDVVALVDSHTKISGEKVEEAQEEKTKRTKEEEGMAARAEELRREEQAAKLKEQRKLEERSKAKEALERKKRNAERAQARAVIKARKEAEEREKQREKKAKKKERKMAAAREAGNGLGEKESAEVTETPTEAPKESENTGKQATATKRSRKLSQHAKQSKAKFIPPPLRNRGKRRLQPWMWVLLTALVVLVLCFVGQQRLLY